MSREIEVDQADVDKFWSKVVKTDGCWLWKAGKHKDGRGVFAIKRKTILAPRVSWTLANGCIPDGMLVCHHCDNPGCVRPDHLFLGTQKRNMEDAKAKKRMRQHQDGYVPICGEVHYKARLSESDVIDIKNLVRAGRSSSEVAKLYGVHPSTVQKAVSGKNWKHLGGPR